MKTVPFFKKEVEKFQYFQLPQWLFKEPYSGLSNAAKLSYAFIFDRLGFSVKNEWHDKDGKVFIYFTNAEFAEILNCSEKSVIKAKKELSDIGLLREVRQGLSKPNRIYLLGPSPFKMSDSSVQELENLQSRTVDFTATELEKVQTIKTNNTKTNISNNNIVKQDVASQKVQFRIPYQDIIDYLNKATGKKFSPQSKANKKLIKARWSEGYRLDDFKKVVDNMAANWAGTEWEKYLQPSTLFRDSNFDKYLNQVPFIQKSNVPEWSNAEIKTEQTEEGQQKMAELFAELEQMEGVGNGSS
ncbi:phage replication protein [Streptococcus varani]|uniref:Phage replication protein n=1 Tax=Streptococcus varani TaxID=1608583 RepID=A0A0E4H7L7_9STRE|nr:conserved phage C-terminal domain-containing protein [Streptococcus varani]CQR24599.1 phage replication protein [Streptococcus varani]